MIVKSAMARVNAALPGAGIWGASRLAGTPERPIIDLCEVTSLVIAGSSGGGGSSDHRLARVAVRCV